MLNQYYEYIRIDMIVNQDNFFFQICYNFTYYMDPEKAILSRLKRFKLIPRLILKWGIKKCQYFDPKLPTCAVANSLPHISFTYYMDPKTAKSSRLNLKSN